MNTMRRSALAGLTALAGVFLGAGAVQAQPVDGLYIAAGGGYNYRNEIDVRSRSLFPEQRDQYNDANGYVGVGSIGWGLGDGWRFEIEGNYRGAGNHLKLRYAGYNEGKLQLYGAMANAFFDLDVGSPYVFPYLGVGAGFAETRLSDDATNDEFAFQAIAGAAFPIPYIVGLSATAEARAHIVPANTKFFTPEIFEHGQVLETDGGKFGHQYNFSALVGLRYAFDVTPPAPPPAPAPAPEPPVQPAKSYLVFFDWDKATLTERARQIIHEAADNSTHVQYTRIEVNGYTDTSGTPKYNQGLSVRRAQAVEAELVRDGVPRAAISIQGFGETHLLVPTGRGVREPQNRRVEIIIR